MCNPQFCRCVDCRNLSPVASSEKGAQKQRELLTDPNGPGDNDDIKGTAKKRTKPDDKVLVEQRSASEGVHLDSFLPPSFFATPLVVHGALTPALSFSIAGSDRTRKIKSIGDSRGQDSAYNRISKNIQKDPLERSIPHLNWAMSHHADASEYEYKEERSNETCLEPSTLSSFYFTSSRKRALSSFRGRLGFSENVTTKLDGIRSAFSSSMERTAERSVGSLAEGVAKAETEPSLSEITTISPALSSAVKTANSVKELTKRILGAAHSAKVHSQPKLVPAVEKSSAMSSNSPKETDDDESDLLCLECDVDFPKFSSKLLLANQQGSNYSKDRNSFLAAQETAILRSLAVVMKSTALELSAVRRKAGAHTAQACGEKELSNSRYNYLVG